MGSALAWHRAPSHHAFKQPVNEVDEVVDEERSGSSTDESSDEAEGL